MRRAKRESRLAPFTAGVTCGYIATLAAAVLGALLVLLTDSAESFSGVVAMVALAVGSFASGRLAGSMRRRGGLFTGAVSGLLYVIPFVLLSVVFGVMQGVLLFVKLILCVVFGAAGGVVGVNSSDA